MMSYIGDDIIYSTNHQSNDVTQQDPLTGTQTNAVMKNPCQQPKKWDSPLGDIQKEDITMDIFFCLKSELVNLPIPVLSRFWTFRFWRSTVVESDLLSANKLMKDAKLNKLMNVPNFEL